MSPPGGCVSGTVHSVWPCWPIELRSPVGFSVGHGNIGLPPCCRWQGGPRSHQFNLPGQLPGLRLAVERRVENLPLFALGC